MVMWIANMKCTNYDNYEQTLCKKKKNHSYWDNIES